MSIMKDNALLIASHGIPIFPLHTPLKSGGCSCGKSDCNSVGKHPRYDPNDLVNGVLDATTDLTQIVRWWRRWPAANIGIATGRKSGIVVVDVDSNEGKRQLASLVDSDTISKTALAQTGNGGFHVYFRSGEEILPNRIKSVPGLDVRAEGGYVVAPPSTHHSGETYKWLNSTDIHQLPRIPDSLHRALFHSASLNGHSNGSVKLTTEDWTGPIPEGRRNQEITRRAGRLLSADLPPSVVLKTLLDLNQEKCRPPLAPQEVARIVDSIAVREQQRRQYEQGRREGQNAEVSDFGLIDFSTALRKYGGFETEWAIEGWLPRSTCGLVVAPPGSFKTWILADLATAMVGARSFLGQIRPQRTGKVFIIQQEDFLPALISRICLMLGAPEPKEAGDSFEIQSYMEDLGLFFHETRELHFSNPAIVKGLWKKIEEHQPELVIIDPLYSAVDMKDYMSQAAQQMMILKTIRDETGCSFMIAHHTNKGKEEGGRQRDQAWGSQFLNAWLETGWQLRGTGQEEEEVLEVGANVQVERHFKVAKNEPMVELKFKIDSWSYQVMTEDSQVPSPERISTTPAHMTLPTAPVGEHKTKIITMGENTLCKK